MAFLFVVYVPYSDGREGEEEKDKKLKLLDGVVTDNVKGPLFTIEQANEENNEGQNTSDDNKAHDSTNIEPKDSANETSDKTSVEKKEVNNVAEGVDSQEPAPDEVPSSVTSDGETLKPSRSVGKFTVAPASEEIPASSLTAEVETETLKPSRSVGKFTVEPASETDVKQSEEAPEGTSVDPGGEADEAADNVQASGDTAQDMEGDKDKEEVKETEGKPNEEEPTSPSSKFDEPLIPLVQTTPLYKVVTQVLQEMNVENFDVQVVGENAFWKISFVQEDSRRCEKILVKLKSKGIGHISRTSLSIFPSSVHVNLADDSASPTDDESDDGTNIEAEKKETQFKKSIKSRLVVDQVVSSVKSNAIFTFDYLLLLLLASMIACLGLVENSSVVLVASMLISPLMGPILAITFGQVVQRYELRNLGLQSELIGLSLCLVVGCVFGLITGGIGLHGDRWGSSDAWPTTEMRSRGMLRSLWVGILIALPSGAGVAISVLGGNAGSLVGVAISASLLPPACNAGMLWAYAFLAGISPPERVLAFMSLENNVTIATTVAVTGNITGNSTVYNVTTDSPLLVPVSYTFPDCAPLLNNAYVPVYSCNVAIDALLLGVVSLFLTLLNITCILIMGVIVLRIKEVAPHTAGTSSINNFWQEDVKVARSYYITTKGEDSINLGKEFLKEWTQLKNQMKDDSTASNHSISESESSEGEEEQEQGEPCPSETIAIVTYLAETEQSASVKDVLAKLPVASESQVARSYYTTSKGDSSKTLGEEFLAEWKRLGYADKKKKEEEGEEEEEESGGDPADTLNAVSMIAEVEGWSIVRSVLAKLSPSSPPPAVAASLYSEFNNAAHRFNRMLAQDPGVYLTQHHHKDGNVRGYSTIQHGMSSEKKTTLRELRSRFRKTGSLFIETLDTDDGYTELQHPSENKLHKRRRNKVKFHVSKVEEEQELV